MRNSDATSDSLGRRSRMRANSTGKRIRLTDRDRAWFDALHRHGPLTSAHLLKFTKQYGTSNKRATERLTDLFHEDNTALGGPYLQRPTQQFQTIDARYKPLVYDLAPAGMRELKQREAWSGKAGPSGGPWWHSFMTASFTGSIELGILDISDLRFIPQAEILERAQTTISTPIEYVDPDTGRVFSKTLCPDAIFGIEYLTTKGSRFRFYAVEADRGTEPLTSSNTNRKSAIRNFVMYDAYIRRGLYKRHLKLTAPLLVLNVCSSQKRVESMLETLTKSGIDTPYQLFQTHADVCPQTLWLRAGYETLSIE